MDCYKYMQLIFDITNQDIIYEYNFTNIAHNGKVCIDIRKGMYGLPQSGRIAHDRFKSTWRSMDTNLLN